LEAPLLLIGDRLANRQENEENVKKDSIGPNDVERFW